MGSLRLLTLLLLSALYLNSYAQQQPKHEWKFYTDDKGRLYVNKNLPMYMRLSYSPDSKAESYLMKSESSPQYSNPFYFDTEGLNTVRTPSKVDTVTKKVVYPIEDIIFEIYADGIAPKTNFSYGSTPKYKTGGKTFLGKDLQIPITTKDEVSGIQKTYYSVNGAAFTPYSKEVDFSKEGDYKFQYYSVDNVGNSEKVHSVEFSVDITPPVSSHEVSGDHFNTILSKRTKFELKSEDKVSGLSKIYYQFDNGTKRVYTGKISVASLSEGEHTLKYYAIDHVKNEEAVKEFKFYVDKTPPIVVEEVLGDSFFANGREYSSGRTKLKLTAVDNKAGVEAIYYSINGSEYKKFEKPFYFSNRSGNLTVKSYAIDKVGNKSQTEGSKQNLTATYVDLTGPALNFYYAGPKLEMRDTMFISTKTKIGLKASDSESGMNKITYILDKTSETEYKSNFKVDKEGVHKIEYFGYDNVNNSNRSDFFFVVDDTGPQIFETFGILPIKKKQVDGKTLNVYPSHVALFLSATDDLVGYEKMFYSINGGPEKRYTDVIQYFKKNEAFTIKVRALDKLGNEKSKDIEFFIE